jgi:hypothetical protein
MNNRPQHSNVHTRFYNLGQVSKVARGFSDFVRTLCGTIAYVSSLPRTGAGIECFLTMNKIFLIDYLTKEKRCLSN